ncbi:glycerophosphodiester phosphodiesterase family protein [Sphingobacterium suaedae]
MHVSNHNQIFNFAGVEDLYRFLTYSEKRVPLVSAHRGGPDVDYPENALETFQRVAYKTPAIIECDIALTKDSVLVLIHDETLDRTTTGKGRVNRHTLDELNELYLKDETGNTTNYRIPTLDETLAWGVGKVIFTLDVKKNVPYRMVIDAIRRTKSEAYVVIITYSADQAAVVHNLAPDLMISASIKNSEDLVRLNDRDVPDTRLVAFVGTSQADKKLTDLLHQHGILCILGTIGNLDDQAAQRGDQLYAEFIENGADILSTDRPLQAAKSLSYYIQKRELSSPYIN